MAVIRKQKIRRRVNKVRVSSPKFAAVVTGGKARLVRPNARSVPVEALRRQVRAGGRLDFVPCTLVKEKARSGEWIIRLQGGITGREYIRVRKHIGDHFYRLRLRGWTVHEGRTGDDPRHDYLCVPGREMEKAIKAFGWL